MYIVFDLDETLIFTSKLTCPSVPFRYALKKSKYNVYRRPGFTKLFQTLKRLQISYSIWSAASPSYVDEIVSESGLFRHYPPEHIWSAERCDLTRRKVKAAKPLSKFAQEYQIDKDQLLLVEDDPDKCQADLKTNVILVPVFRFLTESECHYTSRHDRVLFELEKFIRTHHTKNSMTHVARLGLFKNLFFPSTGSKGKKKAAGNNTRRRAQSHK